MAVLQRASGADDDNVVPLSLHTRSSSLIEKSLEYSFLGQLTAELLRRGQEFEILRADCDRNGHDLVIEVRGIMRHIQLKAMKADGARRDVSVNIDLAAKPSGCVIWMIYNPEDFTFEHFRWFGGEPGRPLPELGDKLAKHSRADADGLKAERPQHRLIASSRFTKLESVAEITDYLFGRRLGTLAAHLLARPLEPDAPAWAAAVRAGLFDSIPANLNWEASLQLAMLIDGYQLAEELGLGDPMMFEERQLEAATSSGEWPGTAVELWITLFLEHRRWRFSAPCEPNAEQIALLDRLVAQLQLALLDLSR